MAGTTAASSYQRQPEQPWDSIRFPGLDEHGAIIPTGVTSDFMNLANVAAGGSIGAATATGPADAATIAPWVDQEPTTSSSFSAASSSGPTLQPPLAPRTRFFSTSKSSVSKAPGPQMTQTTQFPPPSFPPSSFASTSNTLSPQQSTGNLSNMFKRTRGGSEVGSFSQGPPIAPGTSPYRTMGGSTSTAGFPQSSFGTLEDAWYGDPNMSSVAIAPSINPSISSVAFPSAASVMGANGRVYSPDSGHGHSDSREKDEREKDGKKSVNFLKRLRKMTSRAEMKRHETGDDYLTPMTQYVPPLPYGSSSSTINLHPHAVPPSSPTREVKKKKSKNPFKPGSSHSASSANKSQRARGHSRAGSGGGSGGSGIGNYSMMEQYNGGNYSYGMGQVTTEVDDFKLDTNLNDLEGIVDLKSRALAERIGLGFGGFQGSSNTMNTTTTTTTSNTEPWEGAGVSSSWDTNEAGSPTHLDTKFTDPFAVASTSKLANGAGGPHHHHHPHAPSSHTRTASSTSQLTSKRKSGPPAPLRLNGGAVGAVPHSPNVPHLNPFNAYVTGGGVAGPISPTSPERDPSKDPAWKPPESWDVDKLGPDAVGYSSGEEENGDVGGGVDVEDDFYPTNGAPGVGFPRNGSAGARGAGSFSRGNVIGPRGRLGSGAVTGNGGLKTVERPNSRRGSEAPSSAGGLSPSASVYSLRVHRMDGTFHTVSCPIGTNVSDLTHVLKKRLLINEDTYKLYLKEKGRERVLGNAEKPIMILRRRLEQAGYDESDDLETIGNQDLGFLLKFVFRNATVINAAQAQGDEESYSSEYIDLTGKGLLTIPIALHRNAPNIVTLNLSKNPHVDLPSDFIQSCDMLRELRLCHSALKKVLPSVQKIKSLHWLDISCNRIVDVNDAGLDHIPDLRHLQIQNNRLSTLPDYLVRMGTLKYLNISNNKFEMIPKVLCEMRHLVDLDVSFNMISEFPVEMGHLENLETLVIVGNKITSFPPEIKGMVKLKELDCRRNLITDISPVFQCPKLELLRAENNLLHGVDLIQGTRLRKLCVQGNERLISFAVRVPESEDIVTASPYFLTIVDLTKCMLSSLDDLALSQLKSLTSLKFDHNIVRTIPDAVCHLPELSHLSGSNNQLDALPEAIGHLKKLKTLLVHNNNIKIVPQSIWQCSKLEEFNASSNLLTTWSEMGIEGSLLEGGSRASVPPLALSLKRLYLADNRLTDDVFSSLNPMKVLGILNLSFNDLYELPPLRLSMFTQLRELYLSGNKFATLPGEDLSQLHHLKVLFLNANRLQTLPTELTKVPTLESLDVGNNALKYNIANWQFDWNWNFNHALQYLNLSGNKRLEIKNDASRGERTSLTDFSQLSHLRMLGLMDVTLSVNPSIPDESEDRRVRTSPSDINGMAYGIADNLGKVEQLSMFDLVAPNMRGKTNECLFGMFGRVMPHQTSNRLTKYLHDNFTDTFVRELQNLKPERNDEVEDAMRRAFLTLNKQAYKWLTPSNQRKMSTTATTATAASDLKNAASALVVYIVVDQEENTRTMYVANVGNILAVVSRKNSNPLQVSIHHDPFDREETTRIRTAEGWVSPKGAVNDELEVSRAFGMFHLLPAVNARPSITKVTLTDQDEFIIIGNRGLWDYVSPQTAVDIARQSKQDPMLAAQRLRDHAMSHGADGSTMIMVVSIGDLFSQKTRLPTTDAMTEFASKRVGPSRAGQFVNDRTLARLEKEVDPPTGHLALVFTDIRNSTSLWEKNPGMPTAMRLHNQLLRRQLREAGGYEVKTEGDAFMVSFPSVLPALLWCLTVQVQLLHEEWPQWILDDDDGRPIYLEDTLVARGLSVRMGIHWGAPNCEPDPITGRMDYFGTMVNRASRISASARGGQIMVSSDVMREIVKHITIVETDESGILTSDDTPAAEGSTPTTAPELSQAIEAIKRLGLIVKEVGEARLKGLEVPEMLSLVYPIELMGRLRYMADEDAGGTVSTRVQFTVEQIRQLAMLAIRVEALAGGRVFKHSSALTRNASIVSAATVTGVEGDNASEMVDHSKWLYTNPEILMPAIKDNATDADLLMLMESMTMRVENALSTIYLNHVGGYHSVLAALEQATRVNPGMLVQALSMFSTLMEQ